MATITDKIMKPSTGSSRPNPTTLTAQKGIGDAIINCDDLTGWGTTTAVPFVMYKVDTSGNEVINTRTDWKGIVSGNTITQLTLTAGTDTIYPSGSAVVAAATARYGDDLADALLVSHNQNGTLKDSTVTNTIVADSAISMSKLAAGTLSLGTNRNSGATLTTSYVTFATLTATSTGRTVNVDWSAVVLNGNSGASRTFDVQVLCDGVATTPSSLNFTAPIAGGEYPRLPFSYMMSSTPAAGSHTWALQLKASANSAVVLSDNYIKVTEVI